MACIISRRFLFFLLVGGSATILQFTLLIGFVEWVDIDKVAASAIAYILSAVYNYLLNYHITFNSKQSHWKTAPKFLGVVVVGGAINTGVFAALLPFIPYVIAQCLAVLVALISNYLLNKYWVYQRE